MSTRDAALVALGAGAITKIYDRGADPLGMMIDKVIGPPTNEQTRGLKDAAKFAGFLGLLYLLQSWK